MCVWSHVSEWIMTVFWMWFYPQCVQPLSSFCPASVQLRWRDKSLISHSGLLTRTDDEGKRCQKIDLRFRELNQPSDSTIEKTFTLLQCRHLSIKKSFEPIWRCRDVEVWAFSGPDVQNTTTSLPVYQLEIFFYDHGQTFPKNFLSQSNYKSLENTSTNLYILPSALVQVSTFKTLFPIYLT